ncbi:MAG: sensor histidine kinase [Dissulfurispiraceae bacterium]
MAGKKKAPTKGRIQQLDKGPKGGSADAAEAGEPEISAAISDMRHRAEEVLQKQLGVLGKIPSADMQNLVHELRVHQIELEMQNEELRRTQQELEASREKYFDLYDLAPAGYVSLNERGTILEANLSVATLLDRERSHLISRPLTRFIHREDQDIYYLCHKHLLATRVPQMCELRMERKGGDFFWVRIDIMATQSMDNSKGLRAIVIDISQRKQSDDDIEDLNRILKQHVVRLELANEEMETFSFSVSHDLRAPLRHMRSFMELLQKRMEGQLDEKSREYAVLIADSAKKMEKLIDDLLSLARLGREKLQKREVNISHIVKETVDQLSEETIGRDIMWKLGELPYVYGEQSLIKLVLVNLISNAVKFTSTRPRAEIEIGCRADGNEDIFFIKDNGVGFNMDYVDRLFGVFQRLHPQTEFDGTGIGLANVRRIIALHEGRTWAEGSVGHGATFHFTLPKPK